MFKWLLKPGPQYSWKRVSVILLTSAVVCCGGVMGVSAFRSYVAHLHATSESGVIQAVVQCGGEYAPLQTTYFAEALELSHDQPRSLSQFDVDEAQERLKATHVMREALVQKIKPNLLYIDYQMRTPVAFLGDYTNTALDADGVLFPYLPYFSPRTLPEVYLGAKAPPNPWGKQIEMALARMVMDRFEVGELKRIDLSQSEASSAGERQLVLTLTNGTILRLTPKNCAQQLSNYFMLNDQMTKNAVVIDLRLPKMAYITYE